jgi:hypothetical protein
MDQFNVIRDCEYLGGSHALVHHNDQSKLEGGCQIVPFTCSKCGMTGITEIWGGADSTGSPVQP